MNAFTSGYFIKSKAALISAFMIFCLLSTGSSASFAQSGDPVILQRLTGKVVMDGIPDESAWTTIDPVPLVMYEPQFGGEMNEETTIRVAYDDTHIYVAGSLKLNDISDLRLNSLYRDRYSEDDTFAIIIDPFNDDENALWFFINPAGVRFDMAVSNDADFSAGNAINGSWNTHWQAETNITETGWTAELKIPFSSMGLQVEEDRSQIGIIVYRYISKGAERHIYPAIPPNWNMAMAKPSKAQDVILEDVKAGRPLYFSPYLLSGISSEPVLNETETRYNRNQDPTLEAGFDLKYNISSNTTLDATFNTDFAQVEADDQQLNLSRFPLFFPEKRQFFQERASVFSFNLGGPSDLFFSRRIGLDPAGEPIRIWGGLRLTSRVDDWDIGFLNMQTDNSELLASENFGVIRLKKKVFNNNSYAGGILTSRISEDRYNYAAGADGVFNIAGDEYLSLKVAQTFDDQNSAGGWEENGFFRVNMRRRANTGFYYSGTYTRSGEAFNPAVGFILRRNFYSLEGSAGYGWFIEGSGLRQYNSSLGVSRYSRIPDNSVESAGISWQHSLSFDSGARFNADLNYNYEDLSRNVEFLPGTTVAEGSYEFIHGGFSYRMAPFNKLRTNVSVSAGGFYDGKSYQLSVDPVWNASRYLEFGGTYLVNSLSFTKRDESFTAHLLRFRVQAAANRRLSGSIFAQYSNVSDLAGLNVRFRYNFGEGRDLWLVYNEQLNTDRMQPVMLRPQEPLSKARVILLKFSYSLNLLR